MKVLIVVTHLLGTGHLSRALTLARAFVGAGHRVRLVSGGIEAPQLDRSGIEVVQLPSLRSDGANFTRLLAGDGHGADAPYLARRRAALCAALERDTDIVITELFPFGRRILADEFLALLQAAAALPRRPLILASVRDILAPPSKPSKARRADAIIAQYYDAVLVHSDPRGTRLNQSWPVSPELEAKLRYTGYVAPPPAGAHPDGAGRGEILVSAGGGAVGGPLFEAAVKAARLMPSKRWRLLVGGIDPNRQIEELKAQAAANTSVEPARSDFRAMLNHAAASVSMCGYNTALDLLQAGIPAVLHPFDAGQEVEQGLRADSLARLPGIQVLRSADLNPAALLAAVHKVMADSPRKGLDLRFDGAGQSVAIACELAEGRP